MSGDESTKKGEGGKVRQDKLRVSHDPSQLSTLKSIYHDRSSSTLPLSKFGVSYFVHMPPLCVVMSYPPPCSHVLPPSV